MPSTDALLRLFPGPTRGVPLRGLYLEDAPRLGSTDRPFVYASFITSLDGRISLVDPATQKHEVPTETANPRDWRLFQELAACADVLVTSGRYVRDLAEGAAQAGVPVSEKPDFADLPSWREARGLPRQPAVAIVSASLDLPLAKGLMDGTRRVYVATGDAAEFDEVRALERQGARVLIAGRGRRVEGKRLVSALAGEGLVNIDMVAGPELLNTLLADDALNRLYLTQASRVLGGTAFDTLLKGHPLEPPADFTLRSLCLDTAGLEQSFAVYDRVHR